MRKKFTETSVALFPEAPQASEDSVERFSRLLERSLAGCVSFHDEKFHLSYRAIVMMSFTKCSGHQHLGLFCVQLSQDHVR